MASNIKFTDSTVYNKHFTINERQQILQYIIQYNNGKIETLKRIGEILEKDPTSISKEVKNHREYVFCSSPSHSLNNKICANFNTCQETQLCKKCSHFKKYLCKSCIRCYDYCKDYVEYVCPNLKGFPWVCDGCPNLAKRCPYNKYRYNPNKSDKQYKETLKDCRRGIRLSERQFEDLDSIVSGGLNNKQTLAHIIKSNEDNIIVSERTIYRYFELNLFGAKNIDLPRKVTYKPRKTYNKPNYVKRKDKENRTYEDYVKYIKANPDVFGAQMDCVEGKLGDKVRLLTIHFPNIRFMLGFLIPNKEAVSVLNKINEIQSIIGLETFKTMFPFILTDNGSEFTNPQGLEIDPTTNEQRTKIFYCHPNAAYEKGAIENNHRYIRYIIPKGTSFNNFDQEQISLMFSHINCTKRNSTGRSTPYNLACELFGEETINNLGIKKINSTDVCLGPKLFKQSN